MERKTRKNRAILNSQLVKDARTALGITMLDASKQAGFTTAQQWERLERGDVSPTIDVAYRVARVLHRSLVSLIIPPTDNPPTKPTPRIKRAHKRTITPYTD